MTMTDPIADMLTRLRNANVAMHDVHRNFNRNDGAALRLSGLVVRLAKIHDRHTVRTEGSTHRRCRRGSPCGDLDLDDGRNLFLGHDS